MELIEPKTYILDIGFSFFIALIFAYSIPYFHEIGHYLAALLMGFQHVTMEFTKYGFPHAIDIGLDESKLRGINPLNLRVLFCLISGPIVGLIPFAVLYLLPVSTNLKYVNLIFVVWYLVRCCSGDFRTVANILNIN